MKVIKDQAELDKARKTYHDAIVLADSLQELAFADARTRHAQQFAEAQQAYNKRVQELTVDE